MQNLMIMNLHTGMTQHEVEEAMKDMAPVCTSMKTGFFVCLDGYENDKRELWQIPEVASFFKMLIRVGFISFLEVSSSAEGITRLTKKQTDIGTPGFGALEIWMIANNKMGNGKTDIEREEMKGFLAALEQSNKTAALVTSSPKRTDFKKTYTFCDGQQKFKGGPKWNTK